MSQARRSKKARSRDTEANQVIAKTRRKHGLYYSASEVGLRKPFSEPVIIYLDTPALFQRIVESVRGEWLSETQFLSIINVLYSLREQQDTQAEQSGTSSLTAV